ncbi:transcriptional regulator FtrA [Massilia yuzhufengensis]|uniref:Transcriptional regulator, AraC family with amidase-like domain n=1 Tax=Massilia yuzhufengensis TaxID=1164594 RepID=A0A1I1DDU9_9BURK|nr:transcriptional regulator FtrA [Massilia yuzhufengensis]SFB70970.1 transcriptional regulator, AraC family with amidase-like domain [Massilia yuzhufengensis]
MPHHVAILAYDGLCTFEFGCAVELFALERPELGVPWYSHAVCAAEPGPLRATGGLAIHVPHGLDVLDAADTIVIPGWRDVAEPPPPALADALLRAHARGARIATICSGTFVLAHAGLLDGRKATTHWRYLDRLAQDFPLVDVQQGVLYAQDERIVTSAGSAAGLDMLLHLVRSDYGVDVAGRVAQRLVIPAHRDGDQAQLVARPLPSLGENSIAHLMDWVRENLRAEHTVASMAIQARMGTRSFQRHFKDRTGQTPLAWLVRERVTLAAQILETRPSLAIDAIADLAGLGSVESLRRHFRTHGMPSPARYRRLSSTR